MAVTTAVVLAGGAGLRLRPFTDDKPKALVPIRGKPLLEHILMWLRGNGVRRVIVGVAYKPESITEYFGTGKSLGLKIQYSQHTVEGGTVEGYRLAIERHVRENAFFAMNGDELMNLKLQDLAKFHTQHKPTATIAVAPMPSPYGVVELNGDDITGFHEKTTISTVHVSMGVYVFQREVLDYLPRTGDIERTTFPRLASERKLKAYKYNGFWININTAKDIAEAESKWQSLDWSR